MLSHGHRDQASLGVPLSPVVVSPMGLQSKGNPRQNPQHNTVVCLKKSLKKFKAEQIKVQAIRTDLQHYGINTALGGTGCDSLTLRKSSNEGLKVMPSGPSPTSTRALCLRSCR
jgi:hypothetical protein